MRISDWSSDVCSSDLVGRGLAILDKGPDRRIEIEVNQRAPEEGESGRFGPAIGARVDGVAGGGIVVIMVRCDQSSPVGRPGDFRSEEHTSELQSLMRISYAVFCLKKKNKHNTKYPI